MTQRGMAINSSEQVPGQQTDESSRKEMNRDPGENADAPERGDQAHDGEGTPSD
jgi:hypothetical protein